MSKIDYSSVIENDFEKQFYENLYEKIKGFLLKNNNVTFWKIVREVGGSDRRILRLLNQMKLSGEIEIKNKLIKLSGAKSQKSDISFEKILSKMKRIAANKPHPTFLYDQRPVTLETTVNRAAYLFSRGDLTGKKIAVIGDDDLTSIALALTLKAAEIKVFDIDKRLVDFINEIARKNKLNLKAYEIDLTKEIPKNFLNYFDVFLTDPTPKPEAFELFISVGINLLKNEEEKIGYVSYFPSHQKVELDFQKILTEKKLIVTDMIPKFTEYDFIKETYRAEDLSLLNELDSGEKRLSFHENLTRFETTKDTKRNLRRTKKVDAKNIIGKATKRTLENIEKDPAFINGETDFVISVVKKMREEIK